MTEAERTAALALAKEALELAARATPGPWRANQSDDDRHLDWIEAPLQSGAVDHVALVGGEQVAEVGRSDLEQQNADSDFIAHSRDGYPTVARALLSEHERAEALEKCVRELDAEIYWNNCGGKPPADHARIRADALARHRQRQEGK